MNWDLDTQRKALAESPRIGQDPPNRIKILSTTDSLMKEQS